MSGCEVWPDIDVSNFSFPGPLPEPLPTWEVGLKIGACVLVEFVAIFGNLLLIAVVLRSPRLRRTPTNCYIANMAVADLVVALVPMWVHVTSDVISMGTGTWPLGSFLCKFNIFVQVTAMTASVMTLMAIACDRFFAIIFPLRARVTERRVGVVLGVVWLIALGIGVPPTIFYTYTARQWKNYFEAFCTDVWPVTTTGDGECDNGLTSRRAYWTTVTVMLNWLPMAVMTVAYGVIVHRLKFSRVHTAAGDAVQQRSTGKVIKMLLIVLVTFMACTIPFQVTTLYPIYALENGETLPVWHRPLYFGAVFLMYSNSAINPILYGGLNERFRRGAWDLLRCVTCRAPRRASLSGSTRMSSRLSVQRQEKAEGRYPPLEQLAVSSSTINISIAALEGDLVKRGSAVSLTCHSVSGCSLLSYIRLSDGSLLHRIDSDVSLTRSRASSDRVTFQDMDVVQDDRHRSDQHSDKGYPEYDAIA